MVVESCRKLKIDLQFLFFAHKNLYKYNYFSTILIRFYMYMYNTDLLYIYFDNHQEVITCIFHFIDCLVFFFLVRLFMRVTGTVLCIPWPSTVPVYLSHWTYKSRPLTSAATSDLNMDPRVRKDQKAATSDLNIFIACSQECRRIKNKFWQPTSSLQHLHVQSEMTFWNLS